MGFINKDSIKSGGPKILNHTNYPGIKSLVSLMTELVKEK